MITFRTTVVFDYVAPDGTDPDVFHDDLRVFLEGAELDFQLLSTRAEDPTCVMETVRDITVEELDA